MKIFNTCNDFLNIFWKKLQFQKVAFVQAFDDVNRNDTRNQVTEQKLKTQKTYFLHLSGKTLEFKSTGWLIFRLQKKNIQEKSVLSIKIETIFKRKLSKVVKLF